MGARVSRCFVPIPDTSTGFPWLGGPQTSPEQPKTKVGMHKTALPEIVREIRGLEPLPAVVTRVLEIGARDDVVPDDLIDVMRTDLGITCKVLKVCNSAYYGLQREIASMKEAGNVLGASALVNLVLTCGANKYFHDHGATSGRDQTGLWRRCLKRN